MRTLVLHGAPRQKFGKSFQMDADTIPMMVRGIGSQVNGFMQMMREGRFKVVVDGKKFDVDQVQMELGDKKEIHITPVLEGSGGWGKAIIGAIIIGFAIVASGGTLAAPLAGMAGSAFSVGGAAVTWGTVAQIGAAVALSGVAQILSPAPQTGNALDAQGADQRPSFVFNGTTNVSEQGGPMPVVYGRFRVGSVIGSVDISTEQVAA